MSDSLGVDRGANTPRRAMRALQKISALQQSGGLVTLNPSGGLSSSGAGLGVLLADASLKESTLGLQVQLDDVATTTPLLSFDFTALTNGTVVGSIGGSGATWYCSHYNTSPIPGPTKVDNSITVSTAGGSGAMAGASGIGVNTSQAQYVPALATTASYIITANIIAAGNVAAGIQSAVGVFFGTDQISHSGTYGVTVLVYLDELVIFDTGITMGGAIIATGSLGLSPGVAYDLTVAVEGFSITATINGSTVNASYRADPTQTGLGFVCGNSVTAPTGVRNFRVSTGPTSSGLQVGTGSHGVAVKVATETLTLTSAGLAVSDPLIIGSILVTDLTPLFFTLHSGGSADFAGTVITSLATPSAATDGANKGYVDGIAQGLQIKPTARLATAAALPTNVYSNGSSGVGATLTGTSVAALVIDGIAVVVGDVVLVKNEAASARNGLYTVTSDGVSFFYILTRSTAMNVAADFSGAFVPVGSAGTANANSLWLANPTTPVTVGATSIPFTQLNGATDLIAGTAISISGNTISGAYTAGTAISIAGASIALNTTATPILTGLWTFSAAANFAVSADPGAPASGTLWYNAASTVAGFKVQNDGVQMGGTWVAYQATALGATVNNTTSLLASYTSPIFPANFMTVGKAFRMQGFFTIQNNPASGSWTQAGIFWVGQTSGNVGLDSAGGGGGTGLVPACTFPTVSVQIRFDFLCVVRSTGVSGKLVVCGMVFDDQGLILTANGSNIAHNTYTIDTTQAFTWQIMGQPTVSGANIKLIGQQFSVEVLDVP